MGKLLKGLKPYLPIVIVNAVLVAVQGVTELFLPDFMSRLLNNGLLLNGPDIPVILKYGGYMMALSFVVIVAAVISSYLASKISSLVARDLRKKLFVKVNSFSLGEFDKISTSSLITRSTNDITQVQNFIFMMLRIMSLVPFFFIGSFIMTLIKQPALSLVLAVSVPLIALLVVVVAKMVIPLFNAMQKRVDNLTLVSREGLTGVRVIRAFNRQERESERFRQANKDVTDIAVRTNKIMAIMMPVVMIIMNLTTVAVLWFGAKRVQVGGANFTAADLSAVLQYIMHIMFSIIMVTMLFVQIPRATASAKRINEVLDIDPLIFDLTDSDPETDEGGGVEFKNVSFNFGDAQVNAIDNLSFTAKKGKITAIVGSTGSGKSTVLNLIARLYDATEGEIFVSGNNVKDYRIDTLRKKLGFVPQKAFLFSDTVAGNIRYGNENATDEEVLGALKIAQAHDFVMEKEDGINSSVSQGGANFSGGQKQRLAIARAIVRPADVFLFDDSFSALDFKTDASLRRALAQSFKTSTIIIVAQRISTVLPADNIIVLDEGKLVGQGRHKDLLKNCAVYREIAESQLDEEELAL